MLKKWVFVVACWTFILAWVWHIQGARSDIVIIRKVNKKDVSHRDRFNIRRSKCTDIRQGNKCGFYGGFERSPHNPCKCHCPPRRGTISYRNNHWRCTGNEDFRRLQGCGLYLLYESSDSFIKIINQRQWQIFHAPSPKCSLGKRTMSYLSCNGSWVMIPNMDHFVDVLEHGYDQVARGYAYRFRIRTNSLLDGKLVKLTFSCGSYGNTPCILMKIKGIQNCFKKRTKIRIKIRKTDKTIEKNVNPVKSSLPTTRSKFLAGYYNYNTTTWIEKIADKWGKNNNVTGTQLETEQDENSRKQDREVTAIILTLTAVVLGLVVLGLGVNLCFSSTIKEPYKEKHIFHRVDVATCSGTGNLRTSNDVNTSLSLIVELSSHKSMSLLSSVEETNSEDLPDLAHAHNKQSGIS